MPRPKLRSKYSYYNFQLPPEDKERLQLLASSREQTLSNLLLDYVQACDLLRQAAYKGSQVSVSRDGSRVNVTAHTGQVVKI